MVSEFLSGNGEMENVIGEGRWGGAITAEFLEEFVADKTWVHIDIANLVSQETPKPWMDAGGTGAFVPTLFEIARNWQSFGR